MNFHEFLMDYGSVVTFALSFDYTYWTLADARVKKDKHLEIQKKMFGPHVTFFIF